MLVDLCFVAVALATTAAAQQPVWAQCGGIGWSGATTCATGTACTVLNAYYSQCIPVIATTSAQTSSPSVTSSSPTGTPSSVSPAHPMHPTSYWFSFGDSYTQTDFDINGTLPTLDNPMGNPPYPGYTAVGGTNWIDLNTVEYNRSIILTYNFAYGGATIDASLVAPYEPTVLSLTDQVNEFLSTVASQPDYAPWNPTIALFSFWIGINDIGNSYYESGDRDAFSDTLLDAYFALVQKIYITSDVGGRNFLFINVPPVDRSPLMLAQAASAQALEKTVIAGFNSKLAARVTSLAASNTGVQTWLWDSNTAFTTVLNDPTAYGFVDAVSYGNTGDFWGNNYHPSSAAQTLWAQDIAALFNGTFW